MESPYSIAVFEAREDEMSSFAHAERTYPVRLTYRRDPLSLDTLNLTAGCQAVTTLGESHLDAALLAALADRGIRYLSTRTVGYNHIDTSRLCFAAMPTTTLWPACRARSCAPRRWV